VREKRAIDTGALHDHAVISRSRIHRARSNRETPDTAISHGAIDAEAGVPRNLHRGEKKPSRSTTDLSYRARRHAGASLSSAVSPPLSLAEYRCNIGDIETSEQLAE